MFFRTLRHTVCLLRTLLLLYTRKKKQREFKHGESCPSPRDLLGETKQSPPAPLCPGVQPQRRRCAQSGRDRKLQFWDVETNIYQNLAL